MILKYLRKVDWAMIVAAVILVFVQVYLELEIPEYMATITTLMSTGGSVDQVMAEGGKMLICAVVSLIGAIITGAIAANVGACLGQTLRKRQFEQVNKFAAQDIHKFSIPSLITRSTNDVVQVQMLITVGLAVLIRAPVMALWALGKMFAKNMDWTILTVVILVIMLILIAIIVKYVYPRYEKIQWLNDDVNRVTKEGISGIRVVHAYNAEGYQENRFDGANKRLTGTYLSVTRALSLLNPLMSAVLVFLQLLIFWIGAYVVEAATGAMKVDLFSNMIVFSSYAMMVIWAFIFLVIVLMIMPRSLVSAKRIEEVITTEPSIKDGTVTESPAGVTGEISFKNVSFRYPGCKENVFSDVSFDVKKGETIAFVGFTGSGKSTMVNLVPRLYDVTEGSITIDGVDVKDYKLDVLHQKIGYVPQKAVMFKGTIESNVNYGDSRADRTEEDVKKAVAIAQSTDFVEKKDGQYQGMVAENGSNFSGGQKQRLSIARAVCRKPEIYIFDDSFSALDFKTDRILRTTLKKETAGVTTMIVAQRIGTIIDADKIVVIHEGRVVGIGKHQELLKNCDVYREMAASQLGAEEMAR